MDDDRPPIHIETLRTTRLTLTPLDAAADATDLHPMLADPEVHRYDTDADASASVDETARRLAGQLAANGGASWAIRVGQGRAIGTIGVFADQGTTIRGVGWSLARAFWREGITSEAARVVVPYLLAQPGVDGLEAWVDSENIASRKVALAAGMSERARLPRVSPDRVGQTVVMARAAVERDPIVFGVSPVLPVRDVAQTSALLRRVLPLWEAWAFPDPPRVAFLAVAQWSGSPGIQLAATDDPIAPVDVVVDVGEHVSAVRERIGEASLVVVQEPVDQPWYRCDLVFELPEGHRVRVSGPSTPDDLVRPAPAGA